MTTLCTPPVHRAGVFILKKHLKKSPKKFYVP